ncbi:methylmalonyl-CoA mutase small subunit [Aureibaculum sp. A20]|uniref:Methylmalonyl-CoA mutase small subunit n=1 Tax=Aureibaculum flavum TaxID=2795986 RepID=A0ABS0WTS1_9FLAO|nr:methylmalonyl-CoA mutase family protein [Aureibaculum flavum]MBJ2175380.1 methylmalonyl-CoA mutase small subunit [Aureibaculum flavum]
MNDTNKKLFSDFKPATKQEWLEKVNIDLKGADFNRKLVWKNLSKINFQPLYLAEDKIEFLNNTGKNSQSLINYRKIIVDSAEKANQLALKAVEEGMTGLLFEISENISVSTLLEGINFKETVVSFNLKSNTLNSAKDFIAYVKKIDISPSDVKGYFNTALISDYVTSGELYLTQFAINAELIKITADFPNYKAVTISANEYLNTGANQVQEVAYTLSSLVFIIENLLEKGMEVQAIFDNLNFRFAIGAEYFIEIGKFRAFNHLLSEIANKYGVTKFSSTLVAKTSIWNKSVTDAHTNLLRATTEAMSAILGNVDGVVIDAYDKEFNNPSDFSSRIAGNISTILKEESYFGKVSNPVDGSYYIEEVSTKIAKKALELFLAIETNGGYYESFESELIQQQIAEIRQEKIKLLNQRRLILVGVNKYPNLMETVSADILGGTDEEVSSKILKPRRASLEIEAIRKVTEELVKQTNKRPIVELSSFGNLTMRKARAAFAYDFIGVSGFEVRQEKSYKDALEAAEESAKSDSNVVVICSSDQDYDESALNFVKAFRALNKDKVLLLAGNPTNIIDELTESGLDGCIHMKTDIISTISKVQNIIQKTIKSIKA